MRTDADAARRVVPYRALPAVSPGPATARDTQGGRQEAALRPASPQREQTHSTEDDPDWPAWQSRPRLAKLRGGIRPRRGHHDTPTEATIVHKAKQSKAKHRKAKQCTAKQSKAKHASESQPPEIRGIHPRGIGRWILGSGIASPQRTKTPQIGLPRQSRARIHREGEYNTQGWVRKRDTQVSHLRNGSSMFVRALRSRVPTLPYIDSMIHTHTERETQTTDTRATSEVGIRLMARHLVVGRTRVVDDAGSQRGRTRTTTHRHAHNRTRFARSAWLFPLAPRPLTASSPR